jgi:hypothetical protein
VALLLVFLLFMVSYQSSFHGRWFPLATRWTTHSQVSTITMFM